MDGSRLHSPLVRDDDETETAGLLAASGSGGEHEDVHALRAQLAAQQQLLMEVLNGRRDLSAPPAGLQGGVELTVRGATAAPAPSGPPRTSLSDEDLAKALEAEEQGRTSSLLDNDYDARFARDLQQMEMMYAAEQGVEEPPEPPSFDDPVWGKFVAPEGTNFKPHQVLCISMCPCCIGPYCSTDRKSTYKKVTRTASFILSVLQLLLVLVSLILSGGMAPPGENPMLGPSPMTLEKMGAKFTCRMVFQYQLWRLATPMFLHAGFVHLLSNLVMQLRLAILLELKWGLKMFLTVYFISGLYSALMSSVCIPTKIGVGASGALMGIMGAWFVDILADWGDGEAHLQQQRYFQLVMCFVNMLVILGFSFVPMIDWAAHAFGMVGGLLLMVFMRRDSFAGRKRAVAKWAGLGLLVGSALLSVILMFTVVKSDLYKDYQCMALIGHPLPVNDDNHGND